MKGLAFIGCVRSSKCTCKHPSSHSCNSCALQNEVHGFISVDCDKRFRLTTRNSLSIVIGDHANSSENNDNNEISRFSTTRCVWHLTLQ